jgi:hypothetical protein
VKAKTKPSNLYSDLAIFKRAEPQPPRPRAERRPMDYHKFAVGQTLLFSPAASEPVKVKGFYSVVRLMPPDNGDNQYRLKSDTDGHERVVRESQLTIV